MNVVVREISRPFPPMELVLQIYSGEEFKMLRRIFEASKSGDFSKNSKEMELINQILDNLKLKVTIDNE